VCRSISNVSLFWLSSLPAQFCLDYAWLSALTLSFLCISFIFCLQLRPPSLASPLHVEGVSFGGVKLCRLDESSGPPHWFYEPTGDESDHDPDGAFPVSQFKRSRPKGLAPKTYRSGCPVALFKEQESLVAQKGSGFCSSRP